MTNYRQHRPGNPIFRVVYATIEVDPSGIPLQYTYKEEVWTAGPYTSIEGAQRRVRKFKKAIESYNESYRNATDPTHRPLEFAGFIETSTPTWAAL